MRRGDLTTHAAGLGLTLSVLGVLGVLGAPACSATDARDQGGAGNGGATASGGAGRGGDAGAGAGRGGGGGGSGKGGGAGLGGGSACMRGAEMFADRQTGIPSPDGCNTCSCENGHLVCTERGCPPDDCIVARRLDRCCPVYEAVLQSALKDDECLVADPGPPVDPMLAQSCFERSPSSCAAIACGDASPPSRLAEPDGAGGCSLVDECQSADDCVIASDSRQCCACAASMPKRLLARDACLALEGSAPPPGADCPGCSLPVLCGMCVPPPAAPTCVIGDALNRCE